MQEEVKVILEELVAYISGLRGEGILKGKESIYITVRAKYIILKENGLLDNLYRTVKETLWDAPDLYIYFLSIIFDIVKDDRSITEALNSLNNDNINLFTQMLIRGQIEYIIFQNSKLQRHYDLRRMVNRRLLEKSEEIINIPFPYRTHNLRNQNRIVIVVSQFLSDLHAPTNIIKQISRLLQKEFNMEVLLIVALDDMYSNNPQQVWFNSIILNYVKEYNDYFKIEYKGEIIHGIQFMMNQQNTTYIQEVIEIIYDFNPLFVWSMGTFSIFADFLRKFITVMSMPFSDGYAVSEAQIMCTYLNSHSSEIKDMESSFIELNQRAIQFKLGLPLTESMNIYYREDYGIKEQDFVVVVIGNRLDIEIDQDFIILLKKILEIDDRICVVFIGGYEGYSSLIQEDIFSKRTRNLGYQRDLIGILSIMDLFLNPPRQGGGAGAVYSLFNGLPVVTLGQCDVANSIEPEDICKNFDEMYHLVKKYFYDIEFYKKESNKAMRIREKRTSDIFFNNTKILIDEVRRCLNDFETEVEII